MTYFNFGNNQRKLGGLFDTTGGIGSRKPWDTPGIGDGIGSSVDFEPGTGADTGVGNLPVAGAAPQASKWDKFSDNMSNLAQGLGAAQAFWNGDTETGASILQSGAKARQMAEAAARKRQQELARQQQIGSAIEALDLTPQEKVIAMNAPEEFLQNYSKRFAPQNETEDTFTRSLRAAGVDPSSPQGQELYRQRVSTMAQPAPNFIGDGLGGGRWVQPPAMPLPGGAPAPTQFNVGGEMLTPPRLGQMPTEPPAGAVSMLRSNPALRDQFDAKYGQGAAARYLGGQ